MGSAAVNGRGLGWRPELPDKNDRKFAFRKALAQEIIPDAKMPIRKMVPWRKSGKDAPATDFPVFDQGQLGSCTGNAGATFFGLITGLTTRSRLALYYEARRLINETNDDGGAYIRDIFKVLANVGAGAEKLWPYDPAKVFDDPSKKYDKDALKREIKTYHRLDTGDADSGQLMRSCLAQGYPFEIGFTCYDSFVAYGGIVERTGVLNLPTANEREQGGHAVCTIGFDREFQATDRAKFLIDNGMSKSQIPNDVYIVRNSWNEDWGWNGNFVVDAKYWEDSYLADDAWTGRR